MITAAEIFTIVYLSTLLLMFALDPVSDPVDHNTNEH